MNLTVSPRVAELLERAATVAIRQGGFYVGVNELLRTILEEPDTLPAGVRSVHLDSLYTVARRLPQNGWEPLPVSQYGEIFHTPRAIDVTKRAGKIAQAFGGDDAGSVHLLLAILADPNSEPSRAMARMGLDRDALIEELKSNLLATSGEELDARDEPMPDSGLPHQRAKKEVPANVPQGASGIALSKALRHLTRDLSEWARDGRLTPAIGRDKEIFEVLQILTRKSKNNAIIVGEAGVGKTQLVEGLALWLLETKNQTIPDLRIIELNMASLMAGTQYRGAFEEKLCALVEELKGSPNTIVFIDEIHLIVGAGSVEGGGLDLANLLKPALARGEIRCIGATTEKEYRRYIEPDAALDRRFQMMRLEELSETATLEVLDSLRPSLEAHHTVRILKRTIDAAVHYTDRYMPERKQPDKAIDVLDQACARYRIKVAAARRRTHVLQVTPDVGEDHKVTPHEIRKVISQITGVPLDIMAADERQRLTELDRRMKEKLIGQDEAIDATVAAIQQSRVGLADPKRPIASLLFLGPSGVGKTQLAKLLSECLFGSEDHLIVFNMSEYIEEHSVSRLVGAPPGYVGHEGDGLLATTIRANPYAILLFDEIEKAHPRVFDIFLPILDEGQIRDSRGRNLIFRHAIIIMTTNIGKDTLSRDATSDRQAPFIDALRAHFRAEFLNRFDEIIPFYALLHEDVRRILAMEMDTIRHRLHRRGLDLHVYQRAYEHLAREGYSPDYGVRELQRVVNRRIGEPVSGMILRGEVVRGDTIYVSVEENELSIQRIQPQEIAEAGTI